jgi:hypothetical protein
MAEAALVRAAAVAAAGTATAGPAGPGSISLLLTLASPHTAPPLLLQPSLARFYDSALARLPLPADLPAVSLHGGAADLQVLHLTAPATPRQRETAVLQSCAAIRCIAVYHRLSLSNFKSKTEMKNSMINSISESAGPSVSCRGCAVIMQQPWKASAGHLAAAAAAAVHVVSDP